MKTKLKTTLALFAAFCGLQLFTATTAQAATEAVAVWEGFSGLETTLDSREGNHTLTKVDGSVTEGVYAVGSSGGVTIAPKSGNFGTATTVIMDVEDIPSSASRATLVDLYIGTANKVLLDSINNNFQFYWNDTTYGDAAALPSAGLRRVAMTYNGGGKIGESVYVDGVKQTSGAAYSSGTAITTIALGAKGGNAQVATNLKIHRVAIFSSALSDAEVAAYGFPSEPYMKYHNKLAGDQVIEAKSYGDITVTGGGIAARAFTGKTNIISESGEGIGGNFSGLFGNNIRIQTHTVSGWFKVDTLPSSGSYKLLWSTRNSTTASNLCGYGVEVGSDGKVYVGRITNDNDPTPGIETSISSSAGVIVEGQWCYLTLSIDKTADNAATVKLYKNGGAAETLSTSMTIAVNGTTTTTHFYVGAAGVSAAGFYIDNRVLSDTTVIKSLATNEKYVHQLSADRFTATLTEATVNWSEIKWNESGTPTADSDIDITASQNCRIVFAAAGAVGKNLTLHGDHNIDLVYKKTDPTFTSIAASGGTTYRKVYPSDGEKSKTDAWTVPTDTTYVIEGGTETADTWSGAITVPNGATLVLANKGSLTASNPSITVSNGGTLVTEGEWTVAKAEFPGTVTVNAGGTLTISAIKSDPQVATHTLNVYGNLVLNCRYACRGDAHFNLYAGATVSGTGDQYGAFDMCQTDTTIKALDSTSANKTIVITAPWRLRSAGMSNNTIDIASGVTVDVQGQIGYNTNADGGAGNLIKTGAGTLKFSGSETKHVKGDITINEGAFECGVQPFTDTSKTLTIASGATFAPTIATINKLTLNSGAIVKPATALTVSTTFTGSGYTVNATNLTPAEDMTVLTIPSGASFGSFSLSNASGWGLKVDGTALKFTQNNPSTFNVSELSAGQGYYCPGNVTLNFDVAPAWSSGTVTLTVGGTLTISSASEVIPAMLAKFNLNYGGISCAWPTRRVISINYAKDASTTMSGDTSDGALAGLVYGSSWNNVEGQTGTDVALEHIWTGSAAAALSDVTVSWTSSGAYGGGVSYSAKYMKRYLDDNGTVVSNVVSGITFDTYSVIIYYATDNSRTETQFHTPYVNGKYYTADGVTGATSEVDSRGGWGVGKGSVTVPRFGSNVIRIDGLTGSTLTIDAHKMATQRGSIAAIQIIDCGAAKVAKINETKVEYETVEAAFEAVTSGQTITLLTDASETLTAKATDFTLALDGHTLGGSMAVPTGSSITLNYGTDGALSSTVTGAGTIVYDGTLPGDEKTSYQAEAWTGTVWLKSQEIANFDFANYGHANSKVKVTGITGYAINQNLTFGGTLILADNGSTAALTISNGYYENCYTVARLEGSGTFTSTGTSAAHQYRFVDVSGFTGTITTANNRRVYIGSGTTTGGNSCILIESGAVATVASGKTWTAAGGFVVNGTVNNNGTLTGTVTGSGTIVYVGKSFDKDSTFPTGLTDAANWTGTVWLKNSTIGGANLNNLCNASSKLKFTGVTGWLRNTGDDNVCPQNVPELVLEDAGDTSAFAMTGSSDDRAYTFAKFTGSGTFRCATSASSACAVAVADVSEFTGKLLSKGSGNNPRPIYIADTVTSAIAGTTSLINVGAGETIYSGCGWEATSVAFGATLTVKGNVNDVIVSGVTTAPTLNTTVTLLDPSTGETQSGVFALAYDGENQQVKVIETTVRLYWSGEAWTNGVGEVVSTITANHVLVAKDGDTITFGAATTPYSFVMPKTGTVTLGAGGNLLAATIDVPSAAKLVLGWDAIDTKYERSITGSGCVDVTGKVFLNVNNQSQTWVLTVKNGGTLKMGGGNVLPSNTATVDAGGTLDVNGKKDNGNLSVTLNGGKLTNTGDSLGTGSCAMKALTLTADSEMEFASNHNWGLIGSSHGTTTITLNGHKLTKKGAGTFYLINTTVSSTSAGGNVCVDGGTLDIGDKSTGSTFGDNVTLTVNNGGTLSIASGKKLTLQNLTVNGGTISNSGTLTGLAVLNGAVNFNSIAGTVAFANAVTVESGTTTLSSAASTALAGKTVTVSGGATLDFGTYRPTCTVSKDSTGTLSFTLQGDEITAWAAGQPVTFVTIDATEAGSFGGKVVVRDSTGKVHPSNCTIVQVGEVFKIQAQSNALPAADFPITANVTAEDTAWDNLGWTKADGTSYTGGFDGVDATAGTVAITNTYDVSGTSFVTADHYDDEPSVLAGYQLYLNTLQLVNKGVYPLQIVDRFAGGGYGTPGCLNATTIDMSESTGAVELNMVIKATSIVPGHDTVLMVPGTGNIAIGAGKKVTLQDVDTWNGTITAADATSVICYQTKSETPTALSLPHATEADTFSGKVVIQRPINALAQGKVFGNKTYEFIAGVTHGVGTTYPGGDMTVETLCLGNKGNATQTLVVNGGSITVTGNAEGTSDASVLFGHWPSTVNINNTLGNFTALNALVHLGWDGHAYWTVNGGNVKVKGVVATRGTSSDNTSSLTINGGTFEIGAGGIAMSDRGNKNASLTLGGGLLSAYADATVTVEKGIALTADTTSTIAADAGKTLTVSATLTGTGALTVGTDEKTGAVKFASTEALGSTAITVNDAATIKVGITQQQYLDGVTLSNVTLGTGRNITFILPNGDEVEGSGNKLSSHKYGYAFNDNTTKEAGASDELSISGAAYIDGVHDKALQFRNGQNYGNNFSFGGGDFTVFASVKAPGEGKCIFALGGTAGTAGLLGLRNAGSNQIKLFTKDVTDLLTVTLDEDPEESYHTYAIVYDNSAHTVKMSVDGGAFTETASYTSGTGTGFQFGGIYNGDREGARNATTGGIDEFRLYTRQLSLDETKSLAQRYIEYFLVNVTADKTLTAALAGPFQNGLSFESGAGLAFNTTVASTLTIDCDSTIGKVAFNGPAALTVVKSGHDLSPTKGFVVNGTISTTSIDQLGGTGDVLINATGMMVLTSTANTDERTDKDYSRVKGTGTIKYQGTGWRALPKDAARMPASTLQYVIEQADGVVASIATGTTELGTLSGSKNLRTDLESGDNRNVRVTQTHNSTWDGIFTKDKDRMAAFKVAGSGNEKMLTLTGTFQNNDTLEIESTGSVNLTGTWKGPVTLNGALAGTGTVDGAVTFGNSATLWATNGYLTINSIANNAIKGTVRVDPGVTEETLNAQTVLNLATAVENDTEFGIVTIYAGETSFGNCILRATAGTTEVKPIKLLSFTATIPSDATSPVDFDALEWDTKPTDAQLTEGHDFTINNNASAVTVNMAKNFLADKVTVNSEGKTLTFTKGNVSTATAKLVLSDTATVVLPDGFFGGALNVASSVTGKNTATLVFDMGQNVIQEITGSSTAADHKFTLKVISGVLNFTYGAGTTSFAGREVVADGGAAIIRLSANDATGYNTLATGIKVHNGAQIQMQVRDTFLTPIELQAGSFTLMKGCGESSRAFDLFGNHTWTITTNELATAENPTISYLAAESDASDIDRTVWCRKDTWTINVESNAQFILDNVFLRTAAIGKVSPSSPAIVKIGLGELILNNKVDPAGMEAPWTINGGKVTLLDASALGTGLVTIGANGVLEFDMGLFGNLETTTKIMNIANDGSASRVNVLNADNYPWLSFGTSGENLGKIVVDWSKFPVRGLHFVNFCPKPGTTAQTRDPNGRTSGWIDLMNYNEAGGASVNLKDYKIYRYNISKKAKPETMSNLCDYELAPGKTIRVYISEDYPNAEDHGGDGDNLKVEWYGTNAQGKVVKDGLDKIMIIPQKVNPKKYPMVMLYENTTSVTNGILDQTLVPCDIDDGAIVELGANTNRIERTVVQNGVRTDYGPDVSPVYGIKDTKTDLELLNKHDGFVSADADYWLTLPINPFTEGGTPHDSEIESVVIEYRDFGLTPGESQYASTTNRVVKKGDKDEKDYGKGCLLWEGFIPQDFLAGKAGHLIQFRARILDKGGKTWLAPRGLNKDVGHMWYGFVVQPETTSVVDAANKNKVCLDRLQTFLLFVDNVSIGEMDKDILYQTKSKVPYGARVNVYDTQTHTYYDNVRIDLRGQTSAGFVKKSHGLRFSKVAPLACKDPFTKDKIESRKTSFVADYGDPTALRQSLSCRLLGDAGVKVPFSYPVRLYLNGEYYQLASHSNRFTDELVEDYYGLSPKGYGYKNVGTFKPNTPAASGGTGCEKKTPDDDNETDLTVLNQYTARLAAAEFAEGGEISAEDKIALTKTVMTNFNIAAWVNYLAAVRVTQENDDVWTNLGGYINKYDEWDNPNGDDTLMPLAYDLNLSWGQWYYQDDQVSPKPGIYATNDWFKCHPFYGGWQIRAHKKAGGLVKTDGNDANYAYETLYQNEQIREMFLRRFRTLMDTYLGAPGTPKESSLAWQWVVAYTNVITGDIAYDHEKWEYSKMGTKTDYAFQIWDWTNGAFADDYGAAIDDLWNNYFAPRRQHLYVTHSVTNVSDTWQIGYGKDKNAGIPLAQSDTTNFNGCVYFTDEFGTKWNETGYNYCTNGIVQLCNTKTESLDLSGWSIGGAVDAIFPNGTVIPAAKTAGDATTPGTIWIVYDRQSASKWLAERENGTAKPIIINLNKETEKIGGGTSFVLRDPEGVAIAESKFYVVVDPTTGEATATQSETKVDNSVDVPMDWIDAYASESVNVNTNAQGLAAQLVSTNHIANGIAPWQSYVLGLVPDIKESKPVILPVQTKDASTVTFKLGGIEPAEQTAVDIMYKVWKGDKPGEKKTASGNPVGKDVPIEMPLPESGVEYYLIEVTTPAK